ncbi:MAG TPA: suppressor of fused domain protein [Planctomycetota bacterium]|jgi:hypothetical protein
MPTKHAHSSSPARVPAKSRRPTRAASAKKKRSARATVFTATARGWIARDRKYSEIFGVLQPRGRVFTPAGDPVTLQAGSKLGYCLAQYAPHPDHVNWICVTHGLSQVTLQRGRASQIELIVNWHQPESAPALAVLSAAAQMMLSSGKPLTPGELITLTVPDQGPCPKHWLVAKPDESVPHKLDAGGGPFHMLLLMGISDAEMEFATKVNPELADGRRVLLEALRAGGVYPVSDPLRLCLTRRRDFNRLWENAFRMICEEGK